MTYGLYYIQWLNDTALLLQAFTLHFIPYRYKPVRLDAHDSL